MKNVATFESERDRSARPRRCAKDRRTSPRRTRKSRRPNVLVDTYLIQKRNPDGIELRHMQRISEFRVDRNNCAMQLRIPRRREPIAARASVSTSRAGEASQSFSAELLPVVSPVASFRFSRREAATGFRLPTKEASAPIQSVSDRGGSFLRRSIRNAAAAERYDRLLNLYRKSHYSTTTYNCYYHSTNCSTTTLCHCARLRVMP
jgi:hypothetical protein